jgi:hypothetical protein
MGATRLERPRNFSERGRRIENVLHNILGHVQVDAFVWKGKPFDVLAPKTVMLRASAYVREVLCRRVISALGPKARAGAAKHRGAFVDG